MRDDPSSGPSRSALTPLRRWSAWPQFGETVPGYAVPVLNEREARGGAGILFALGLAMFMYSYNFMDFRYSRLFITYFMVEFALRVLVSPRYAPSLILARWAVSGQTPEYVGAAQKRFAWGIGLALSIPMFVLVVVLGVMTPVKLAICLLCLTLMFFEAAFGICLGCIVYRWVTKTPPVLCPGDACEVKVKQPIQYVSWGQAFVAVTAVVVMLGLTLEAADVFSRRTDAQAVASTSISNDGVVSALLADAEEVRAALADDRTDGLVRAAQRLRSNASALPEGTPGWAHLQEGARALEALGPAPSLENARAAFAELMKGVVALVAADPTLQRGRTLVRCPMTDGYQLWVQADARVDNPYQGHRMRTCGTPLAGWSATN